jgi:hypothetical protein
MLTSGYGFRRTRQTLTATVTATAATNGYQQQPATTDNTRSIPANWEDVRPEAEGHCIPAADLASPSLIHLRPETFGAHHAERATQVADYGGHGWTPTHRLGKRVGNRACSHVPDVGSMMRAATAGGCGDRAPAKPLTCPEVGHQAACPAARGSHRGVRGPRLARDITSDHEAADFSTDGRGGARSARQRSSAL